MPVLGAMRRLAIAVPVTIAGLVAFACSSTDEAARRSGSGRLATLADGIEAATAYMIGACKENGEFVYRLNINPAVRVSDRYNVVRHAGAMYALGMAYQRVPSDAVRSALARSGRFLLAHCVEPPVEGDSMLAVWSPPELTGRADSKQAKLGSAGLGLVGLVHWKNADPDGPSLTTLRSIARFILFLQKADGSYYSKYIPSEGGPQDNWVSLYYPGEAALGLMMLYDMDRDPRWLHGAAQTLAYLARIRAGEDHVAADHWALLASARLLSIERDLPVSRDLIVTHAVQVCRSILAGRVSGGGPLRGGFNRDGRTTPTATRLEGLFAALEFLPPTENALRAEIEVAVEAGIAFLKRAQLRIWPYIGGMPRRILNERELMQRRASKDRATEIRIDYVQHALSAMIACEAWRESRAEH